MVLGSIVTALLIVLLGLIIACAGYTLFKGVVGLLGALVLGGAFFVVGLWIGSFIAGFLGIVVAVVMGIIGAVIGAILALMIANMILSIGFGIVSFLFGVELGGIIGLSGTGSILLGAALAVIGGLLFLILARFMIRAATSVLGGYMTTLGSYRLIDDVSSLSREASFIVCLCLFILVSAAGFAIQSGSDTDGGRKKVGKRKNDRPRGTGKKSGR